MRDSLKVSRDQASTEWNESSTLVSSSNVVGSGDEEDTRSEDSNPTEGNAPAIPGSEASDHARAPTREPYFEPHAGSSKVSAQDGPIVKSGNEHGLLPHAIITRGSLRTPSKGMVDKRAKGIKQSDSSKRSKRTLEPLRKFETLGSRTSLVVHPRTPPTRDLPHVTITDKSQEGRSTDIIYPSGDRDIFDPGEGSSRPFTTVNFSEAAGNGFDTPPMFNRGTDKDMDRDFPVQKIRHSSRESIAVREPSIPSRMPSTLDKGKGKAGKTDAHRGDSMYTSAVILPKPESADAVGGIPARTGENQMHSSGKHLHKANKHSNQTDTSASEIEANKQTVSPYMLDS